MQEEDWQALLFEAQQTFSPSTPLSESDLFAGRLAQINRVLEATTERGKHVILFGERGVGKTSLAKLLATFFPRTIKQIHVIREQCDPTDTFTSVWKKVFKDIHVQATTSEGQITARPISDFINADVISPDDVRREFEDLYKENQIPIIVIDEFDKLEADGARSQIANTIKYLSDYAVNVTIVLVGVGDNIVELIGEHPSVQRCLEQILMPRMEPRERREVLEKIVPRLGMKLESDAVWKISDLSRGLPSYIHALGLYSVQSAIARKSKTILSADVDTAIDRVLEKSQEIVRDRYAKAVHSNRQDSMYREVLLACSLAETNEHGFFTPQSVCAPLTAILGRDKLVPISAFQSHLKKFIERERGEVLARTGRDRAYQFRFSDPVMQPFVIMKGIQQGLVDPNAMQALSKSAQGELPV